MALTGGVGSVEVAGGIGSVGGIRAVEGFELVGVVWDWG